MSGPPAAIVPDDEEAERRRDIRGHDSRVKREPLRGLPCAQLGTCQTEYQQRRRKKVRNTWVARAAFLRSDHVFDRFWHHAFGILDGAGETDFSQSISEDPPFPESQ